jgi:putative ABC transport system ATP-binding protein
VAIARALINRPDILLADEPTGALDSRTSAEIMGIFQGLNRTQGITIVLVTHSDEVAAHADRIIGFRDGLIVSDTPVLHPAGAGEAQAAVLTGAGVAR